MPRVYTELEPAGEAVSLPDLSHDLKLPVTVLEGLWHRGVIAPVSAGPRGLMFPKAKILMWLKFAGELD